MPYTCFVRPARPVLRPALPPVTRTRPAFALRCANRPVRVCDRPRPTPSCLRRFRPGLRLFAAPPGLLPCASPAARPHALPPASSPCDCRPRQGERPLVTNLLIFPKKQRAVFRSKFVRHSALGGPLELRFGEAVREGVSFGSAKEVFDLDQRFMSGTQDSPKGSKPLGFGGLDPPVFGG